MILSQGKKSLMVSLSYNLSVLFRTLLIVALAAGMTIMSADGLHADDKIPVYVSILPQQYFVQQIGKNLVDVQVMVPPGASPATYEPRPAQMKALGQTKLYFSIGVPFESVWLKKFTDINSTMAVVQTDDGIQKRFMKNHVCEETVSRPADGHEHTEHIPDPHIWLSPPLVMLQVRNILVGLQRIDPAHRAAYDENYRSFIQKLVVLDEQLRRLFADTPNKPFMVLHPAWGYFAQAYGLSQIPIETEGKDPKPAQLGKLIDFARQNELKIILAQPQSSARFADQVAQAVNGKVVYADPLSPEWENNLLEVARKIKTTLQ